MGTGVRLLQARHFQPYQASIHNVSDGVTALSSYCQLTEKFIQLRALTATSIFDVILHQVPVEIPVTHGKSNKTDTNVMCKSLLFVCK